MRPTKGTPRPSVFGSFRSILPCLSRTSVLENRENLVKQAAKRNFTDPSKIILDAVPRFITSGSVNDLPPTLRASYDGEGEGGGGSEGGRGENVRITIVEVFTNARQRRGDDLNRVPDSDASFVDD